MVASQNIWTLTGNEKINDLTNNFGQYWTKMDTVHCDELNFVFNSLLTYLFSVNFLSVGFIARIEIIFPVPIGTASGTEKGTLCVIIMNWMVKFLFSEKTKKNEEIFTIDLTLCSKRQIDGEDVVNFCGLLGKYDL